MGWVDFVVSSGGVAGPRGRFFPPGPRVEFWRTPVGCGARGDRWGRSGVLRSVGVSLMWLSLGAELHRLGVAGCAGLLVAG